MGQRITQRIYECAICGKTPEDGEYMYEMCGEHWCYECSNKEDKDEEDV